MAIELRYQLQSDDWVGASQSIAVKTLSSYSIVFGIVSAVCLLLLGFQLVSPRYRDFAILIPLGSGLFIAYQYFIVIPKNCRQTFDRATAADLDFNLSIYPDRFESHRDRESVTFYFSNFQWYKIGKDAIVLNEERSTGSTFHVFPRWAFPAEREYRLFISYLEANHLRSI
jgi:hypothetical protein